MNEVLALGLAWLLLSLPFCVFVGKCISVGMAGDTAMHAAEGLASSAADPVPVVPAQRRPAAVAGRAGAAR